MNKKNRVGTRKNEGQRPMMGRRGRKIYLRKNLEVGLIEVLVVCGEVYLNISGMVTDSNGSKVDLIENDGGGWPKTATSQP